MSFYYPNNNSNFYNVGYSNYPSNNYQMMYQNNLLNINQNIGNNNYVNNNNYQMNNQQYNLNSNFNNNLNNYNNYNQQNTFNNIINYENYKYNNNNNINNFNKTYQNQMNNNYYNQFINNNNNQNQNSNQIYGNQGYNNNFNNNIIIQNNRNSLTHQKQRSFATNSSNYFGSKIFDNNFHNQYQRMPTNIMKNNNLINIDNNDDFQNNKQNYGINNTNQNSYNNFKRIKSVNINRSILASKTTVENNSKNKVVLDFFIRARGLDNVGATCYMNATLQCFYHVKPLSENIINDPYIRSNLKLTSCFKDLIEDLAGCKNRRKFFSSRQTMTEDNSLKDSVKPIKFKNVISEMNPLFNGVKANDSKDLILFLLETMDKELTLRNNKTKEMMTFNGNSLEDIEPQNFKKYHNSIFSDIFYGILKSVMKCSNCKNEIITYSIINFVIFPLKKIYEELNKQNNVQQNNNLNNYYLNNNMYMFGNMNYNMNMYSNNYNAFSNGLNNFNRLNAPTTINPISRMRLNNMNKEEKRKLSLNDCFKMNKNLEYLTGENQIFCNFCRKKSNAVTYDEIYKAPNVLIIILNREKDNLFECEVDFPMELNLNEHITNPSSPKNYELIGVISHLGKSSMEGHFVAYCKHFDESWYLFNDSIVSQDPGKGVYNGVPYILFYKNKNWNK